MYDNEKILQIMPAPEGLRYSYDEGKTTEQVSFLALVELSDGKRDVRAFGVENCEYFTDLTANGAALLDTSSCCPPKGRTNRKHDKRISGGPDSGR